MTEFIPAPTSGERGAGKLPADPRSHQMTSKGDEVAKPAVGSLAWAETSARLSRRERNQIVAGIARTQVAWALERARRSNRSRFTSADVDRVPIVDTAVARAARDLADAVCDHHVVEHCERSYYWSWLTAKFEGLDVDPETLYVANILHDLGLGERNRDAARDGDFAVVGGMQARDLLMAHGWALGPATEVGDSIGMHLNPIVSAERHGALARVLSIGPAMDFFGFGSHRFSDEAVVAVTRRHPRPSSTKDLLPDIEHGPGTRPALLLKLGVGRFIPRNPLDRVSVHVS